MSEPLERFQVIEYDGSMESAKLVLNNLNIEESFHSFNVISKHLTLHDRGLILRPGDYYQYRINYDKFEAIA